MFQHGELQVGFPRFGQVAVGWDGALREPSYGLAEVQPDLESAVEEVDGGWLVTGPGVAVLVGVDGSLTFRGAKGDRLRQSPPVRDGDSWRLTTTIPAGDSVHGLGGRTRWDLRGHGYRCWNTDPGGAWGVGRDPLYVTTPAFLVLGDSDAAHCFLDNPWDGTISVGDHGVEASFTGGPVRWYVSLGTLPAVIDAFTALTGRPAVPPRWALGYHQARWGYGSAAAIREVWQGYKANQLPLSAMHFDIDHMDRFRNFTFNEKFKAAPQLIEEMAADGVETVVIVDAGTARADDYPVYRRGMAADAFCRTATGEVFEGVVWPGATVFPDFTDPAARRWWGEQFRFYAERGVAGFWHDMNEPVCFADDGEVTFPLDTGHSLDGSPGDHRAAHNVYALQMCRASYEGLRRLRPDRRPMLFSRSGWAGMQRYGGHWSGDIHTEWSSLLGTLQQALGFGMSGVGYYGPDIGGFTGHPSPELFTRWFQLASFMPFFRTHCAFEPPRREPWEWGEEVLGRLRTALQRRYRLLPYWYTLAHAAASDGAPYLRPLAWADPALREVADEFIVGDDVLVAPVLQEGATSRSVTLPPGTWYHGDSGDRFEGTFDLAVGPDDVPWFIRAGAVVPTEEAGDLVLLVAQPQPGRHPPGGRLITDAGDGWAEPHEERYDLDADGLHRTVVRRGEFDFTRVRARSLSPGATPPRLLGNADR